jgi:hypothetical protein
MNSIEMKNVTKKFKSSSKFIFALNEVSLNIKHGTLLVINTRKNNVFTLIFLIADLLCSVHLAVERRPY